MKTFDKEYKLMAVKRVKESGKAVAEVARELDLSANTLHGWMSKFGKHGEDAFPGSGNLHIENQKVLMAYPRIADDRKDQAGEATAPSKNRVYRLMRDAGIRAKTVKKYKATTNSKHDLPVAENLLNREFTAEKPNQKWVSDITYVWTDESWLYLAGVMDLCGRALNADAKIWANHQQEKSISPL